MKKVSRCFLRKQQNKEKIPFDYTEEDLIEASKSCEEVEKECNGILNQQFND